MTVIGITGGIGSGKTTVCAILSTLGVKIIDADKIAAKITAKGGKALDELIGYFGADILDSNGEMDRQKMAELVFSDYEKLAMLNKITHKYVIEKIIENINSAKADEEISGERMNREGINREKNDRDAAPLIAIDAPIPVKHGFLDFAETVWVVTAERNLRIKRIMERNGLDYISAEKRMDAQMKEEDYLKIADEIIYNNGSYEELRGRVETLLNKLR